MLFFSSYAIAETNADSFIKRINEILNSNKGISAQDKAELCFKFGDYLKGLAKKSEQRAFTKASFPIYSSIITDLNTPNLESLKEDQLENIHTLYQSCDFLISKPIRGILCPECKGIDRIAYPAFIKQKISSTEFLSHSLYSSVSGKLLPQTPLIINRKEGIVSPGNSYFFLANAGNKNFEMMNGFSKNLNYAIELDSDRASAVLCAFNKYIELMNKKYKNQFTCGWRTPAQEFYDSESTSLVCVSKSSVKNGKVKMSSFF